MKLPHRKHDAQTPSGSTKSRWKKKGKRRVKIIKSRPSTRLMIVRLEAQERKHYRRMLADFGNTNELIRMVTRVVDDIHSYVLPMSRKVGDLCDKADRPMALRLQAEPADEGNGMSGWSPTN